MLLIASGCGTPSADPILGMWRIEDVNGGGVNDSSRLEVSFADGGEVSGHAGCNSFSGRYTQDGNAIDIGPLEVTLRACLAEALMLQEGRVLATMEAVTATARQADGALVLTGPPPARLLLRRMDEGDADMLSVSGEAFIDGSVALPEDARLRVTAQDVSRADAPSVELARMEIPARQSPFPFKLEIPRGRTGPQARIAVRAQILSGYAILFTSTEHHGVDPLGRQEPLHIRLSPVNGGTGVGGRPVTPSPDAYMCGEERLLIAFEEGAAFVTFENGESLRLDRLRADSADPEEPRLFTNGKATLRQETEGMAGPSVAFARGRAAFVECRRV
jgi:uncharacterized lipoprotein YbaY